jgi:hypothetical protein
MHKTEEEKKKTTEYKYLLHSFLRTLYCIVITVNTDNNTNARAENSFVVFSR